MTNRTRSFIFTVSIIVLIAIVFFVYISFLTGNAYWLNRGGSLIAAIGAVTIIFQIRYEIEIEKERRDIEKNNVEACLDSIISPIERLKTIIELREVSCKAHSLLQERLTICFIVVFCAFVGEMLHGFGDLLLVSYFNGFTTH